MTNHITPEAVYTEYQVQRNFVQVCYLNGLVDENRKNEVLQKFMKDCIKKIGVSQFKRFNTIEAKNDNVYQGVSL